MSDFKSIQRWRNAMQAGTAPPADRRDCPPSEALAVLVSDPESAPTGLLEHVERCSACSVELKAAGRLDVLDELTSELAPHRRPRWRLAGWVAAASLLLVVSVAVLVQPPVTENVVRNAPIEGLVPIDGARLDDPPARFAWPAADPHTRYQVVLFDELANRMWTSDPVTRPEITLPGSIAERLVAGEYFWQIRNVDTGTVQGSFRFEIVEIIDNGAER